MLHTVNHTNKVLLDQSRLSYFERFSNIYPLIYANCSPLWTKITQLNWRFVGLKQLPGASRAPQTPLIIDLSSYLHKSSQHRQQTSFPGIRRRSLLFPGVRSSCKALDVTRLWSHRLLIYPERCMITAWEQAAEWYYQAACKLIIMTSTVYCFQWSSCILTSRYTRVVEMLTHFSLLTKINLIDKIKVSK